MKLQYFLICFSSLFIKSINSQSSSSNQFKPYSFRYDSGSDNPAQFWREERRNPDGTIVGRYGYVDPNGEERIVQYLANRDGTQMTGATGPDSASMRFAQMMRTEHERNVAIAMRDWNAAAQRSPNQPTWNTWNPTTTTRTNWRQPKNSWNNWDDGNSWRRNSNRWNSNNNNNWNDNTWMASNWNKWKGDRWNNGLWESNRWNSNNMRPARTTWSTPAPLRTTATNVQRSAALKVDTAPASDFTLPESKLDDVQTSPSPFHYSFEVNHADGRSKQSFSTHNIK